MIIRPATDNTCTFAVGVDVDSPDPGSGSTTLGVDSMIDEIEHTLLDNPSRLSLMPDTFLRFLAHVDAAEYALVAQCSDCVQLACDIYGPGPYSVAACRPVLEVLVQFLQGAVTGDVVQHGVCSVRSELDSVQVVCARVDRLPQERQRKFLEQVFAVFGDRV